MRTSILEGKVAVITGSTRGLGLAIARVYAREGAAVVLASRSATAVKQAVDGLTAEGAQAAGRPCDVGDLAQVEALATHAMEVFGRLDVWVNNAGISAPYGPTVHIPPDEVTYVIQTNILGVYYGSLVALRHFLSEGKGKLINVLGHGDRHPVPAKPGYATSLWRWPKNTKIAEWGSSPSARGWWTPTCYGSSRLWPATRSASNRWRQSCACGLTPRKCLPAKPCGWLPAPPTAAPAWRSDYSPDLVC
jgi:hypothetical protein